MSTACTTTKYVAVPELHTKDSTVIRWQHDRVLLHDSVFVETHTAGDTVFQTKYVYRNMLRYQLNTDTLRVLYQDTVYLNKSATDTVKDDNGEPAWYYQASLRFSIMVLLCLAAIMVAWIAKSHNKL